MKKTLLLSLVFLAFACKKDKTPVMIDDLISGSYLCEVIEDYNYTTNNSDTDYDYVYDLTISDDSISFDGYRFPLSSFDEATGTGSHTILELGNAEITLTLTNGHNISFTENYPSYLSGPSWSKTMNGVKTNTNPTTMAHNNFSALGGNYNLFTQQTENYNDIDTAYYTTAAVAFNNGNLEVDGVSRSLPLFHTYHNYTSNWTGGPYEARVYQYYWANDSIYYHHHVTSGQSWPMSDTTHYHYQGSK